MHINHPTKVALTIIAVVAGVSFVLYGLVIGFTIRHTLVSVGCDGFTLKLIERWGTGGLASIDAGRGYDVELNYVSLSSFPWVRYIDSPSASLQLNFYSHLRPEHFEWFAPIQNQTSGSSGTRPPQYWNVVVNESQDAPFTLDEYEKIRACVKENVGLLNTYLEKVLTIPATIGSITYLPDELSHSDANRIADVESFACPTRDVVVINNLGTVSIKNGGPIGYIDERGYFKEDVWWDSIPERYAATLASLDSCVNTAGKSMNDYYADWRSHHTKDFVVAQ